MAGVMFTTLSNECLSVHINMVVDTICTEAYEGVERALYFTRLTKLKLGTKKGTGKQRWLK